MISNQNKIIIDVLNQNLNEPFFISDKEGNLVAKNKLADELFPLGEKTENIFEILNHDSAKKLYELILEILKSEKQIKEIVRLSPKEGKEFTAELILNLLPGGEDSFALCIIKTLENNISFKEKISIQIRLSEIEKIIKNDEVLNLINEIRSVYPFTFVSKNRIKKAADKLKEFFWVKNPDGKLLLVNETLSNSIGIASHQIEGKGEGTFIPSFLVNFQKSINQYILESANCVIIEGLRFSDSPDKKEYETVEVPLFDSENNLLAIIGIGQKKSAQKEEPDNSEIAKNLLNQVPLPVAFIGVDNKVRNFNNNFLTRFGGRFIDVKNVEYYKILPSDISEKVSDFFKSSGTENRFKLQREEETLTINLKKIFKEKTFEGISISIEEDIYSGIETGKENEIFRNLLYGNPEPALIFDKEILKILDVNKASSDLYGYERSEMLKMDMTDLYTQEDLQTLLNFSTEKFKEGIFYGPYNHKRKNGTNILVEISKASVEYKEKEAWFSVIKNVTEQTELERNINLFKAVFDNTDSLVFITDASGFVKNVNNNINNYLKFTEEDLENTSFTALFENDDRTEVNNKIFIEKPVNTISLNAIVKSKDGSLIESLIKAIPVLNYKNEIDSYMILLELKQSEEQENINPAADINIKEKEPEPYQSSVQDPEILSSIFHDILTPINVIMGFVQELMDSIENPTSDQIEANEIINQSRKNLLNSMNSVLEYINVADKGSDIKIEEIKIINLVDILQIDIKNILNKKEFKLEFGKISSSLVFSSDKEKFQSLISLLLFICTRVTKENRLYISANQCNDDFFFLSLNENYSSSSEEYISTLQTLLSNSAGDKNIGIPKFTLLLVNRLLQILNGSVKITADNGKKELGFVFPMLLKTKSDNKGSIENLQNEIQYSEETKEIVEKDLPVERSFGLNEKYKQSLESEENKQVSEQEVMVEEISSSKDLSDINLSELKCLYVEDQVDSQILFKVQMEGLKDIKFAASFEEALPLLKEIKFDFIILDINIEGDYNGIDALKLIHKISGYEKTPIIAATAYLLPGDKDKFINTGFNGFISKPIFHENMIEVLEKVL